MSKKTLFRSSRLEVLFKKAFRPQACNFIKKETLAQVFSSEFYEISKNTLFYRTSPMAAFAYLMNHGWRKKNINHGWRETVTIKTLLDANFVAQKFLFRLWQKERLKVTCKG